jgi:NAD(P)H dehydrogenase (quinone)
MPKLLVLFDPRSDDLTRLAEAVADGARRVRFAEVDVRRIGSRAEGASGGTEATRYRALETADALAAYDGVIVGAVPDSGAGAGVVAPLPDASASLVNKVGSAFAATQPGERRRDLLWSVLTPMADRGMILVPPPLTDTHGDELESAREQGRRVAEVVGWVTHARSHHHHH